MSGTSEVTGTSGTSEVIDAYVHVGLPRFQSVADCQAVMAAAGIGAALACPAVTCPDLASVHQAITIAPDTFRGAGLPLGAGRREVEDGIRAQLDAGFAGVRLSGDDVRDRPWVLDAIGRGGGFALVCGQRGLRDGAGHLLRFLDSHENALVLGGHCAGPCDPADWARHDTAVKLFGHERFAVIISRQGLFPPELLHEWTRMLIDTVTWRRLVWGSEAPVLHWRDEPTAAALGWIGALRPGPAEREAFRTANARRLIFGRPVVPAGAGRPLRLPFDPWDHEVRQPSPAWPHGLSLDTALTARLVHGWLAWGGEKRGPLRRYLEDVLHESLPHA
ncbi:MAG TPA: amidohydrolase family protein [Trebonia sp.]|nr:amidohydrolase family protein [Trebonia sp.]